mmetsp:Transcript_6678/g.25970  ORF Transcript_6678/g.25970 Transcript_6678/m.25970 type:complete len:251 (-) Transcript_6678:68-820(-)
MLRGHASVDVRRVPRGERAAAHDDVRAATRGVEPPAPVRGARVPVCERHDRGGSATERRHGREERRHRAVGVRGGGFAIRERVEGIEHHHHRASCVVVVVVVVVVAAQRARYVAEQVPRAVEPARVRASRVRLDSARHLRPTRSRRPPRVGAPREGRRERVDDRQRPARDVRAEVASQLAHHPRVMREVLLRAHEADARRRATMPAAALLDAPVVWIFVATPERAREQVREDEAAARGDLVLDERVDAAG